METAGQRHLERQHLAKEDLILLPSSREDVTQWRMGNGNLSEYPQIDGCLPKFDFKGSLTGAAAGKVTQRLPGCTITFEL